MRLIVDRSSTNHQTCPLKSHIGIFRLLNRQSILSTKIKMRFTGNEPALRSGVWSLFNLIDLGKYPSAFPACSGSNFINIFAHWRIDGDLSVRSDIDPESPSVRASQLSRNPASSPTNVDMLLCHYSPSRTRAEARTSSTIPSKTPGSIGDPRFPRSSSNKKSSISFRIAFSTSRSYCQPTLRRRCMI